MNKHEMSIKLRENMIESLENCISVSNIKQSKRFMERNTILEQTFETMRRKGIYFSIEKRIKLLISKFELELREVLLDEKERFEIELEELKRKAT